MSCDDPSLSVTTYTHYHISHYYYSHISPIIYLFIYLAISPQPNKVTNNRCPVSVCMYEMCTSLLSHHHRQTITHSNLINYYRGHKHPTKLHIIYLQYLTTRADTMVENFKLAPLQYSKNPSESRTTPHSHVYTSTDVDVLSLDSQGRGCQTGLPDQGSGWLAG